MVKNKVTIIIPVFNEVSFIPDLLLKLKHYHNLGNEIIIIDDGSNDGSFEILLKCNSKKLIQENQK